MVPREYVYVAVKQMFLRDRIAVVANHVGEVKNGERLEVLEHGRRFLRVKTPDGMAGWIEDHAVIDQSQYDQFQALAKQHAEDAAVANAVLYNELYTHLEPGRKTQRFLLLTPNTKVALLERASVAKAAVGSLPGLNAATLSSSVSKISSKDNKKNFESAAAAQIPREDWWLVRDAAGHTGWMLSKDLQVDVPQEVAQYAENEKMVGAYILRTVDDAGSGKPDGKVPEYLTVLTPYKQGLPYDFDQVRVFTWDTSHHRYGTAFRLRDVAGFFPVKVTAAETNNGVTSSPGFSFQVAAAGSADLDPATGRAHAGQLETMTFRMDGNIVRRVVQPGENASAAAVPRNRKLHTKRHKAH